MQKLEHDYYLVTGGCGFIGSHIVEEIIKQGKHVVVVDDLSSGTRDNILPFFDYKLCQFIKDDVSNPVELYSYLKNNRVDIIFHNAASKCTVCRLDPKKDLETNAFGSLEIFGIGRECGVKKVIHASTGSILHGRPKSFYGASKLAAESYLRAMKEYYPKTFSFTAIRYHHVYGPRQNNKYPYGGVIPIFITRMLEKKPIMIFGDGYQNRHFTYVKDIVDINFQAESKWDNHFITAAEPDSMNLNQLVNILGELMGIQPKVNYVEEKTGDIRSFDVHDTVIKKRDFYWAKFRQNLIETIEYYRKIVK